MFRILTSSDEHLSDVNPSSRKDDYRSDILSILEWQGQLSRSSLSDVFIRGGDFFHLKKSSRTSMSTLSSVFNLHKNYHGEVYSISGNHDMSMNNPDTIDRQPLGVLYNSGLFNHLSEKTFEQGSTKIRVVGVDYTTDMDDGYLQDKVKKKDENYTIAIVHALAAMAPEEKIQTFFNEKIFDYRDLVFEGCPDVYVFGHYHKDQGIVDHMGVKFINLGAVSRGALTLENIERKPKMSMINISSSGISVEEIVIPHKDASEVFDFEKKKRIESEKKNLDDFIKHLKEQAGSSQTKEEKMKKLNDYPDDLKNMIINIMESIDEGGVEDG